MKKLPEFHFPKLEKKHVAAGMAFLLALSACAPAAAPILPSNPADQIVPLAGAVEKDQFSPSTLTQQFIARMLLKKALKEVDPTTELAHPTEITIYPTDPERFFGDNIMANFKPNPNLHITRLADASNALEPWKPLKNPLSLLGGEQEMWVAVPQDQLPWSPNQWAEAPYATWQEAAAQPIRLKLAVGHINEASLIVVLKEPTGRAYSIPEIIGAYEQSIKRLPGLFDQIAKMPDPTGLIPEGQILKVIPPSPPYHAHEYHVVMKIPGSPLADQALAPTDLTQVAQAVARARQEPIIIEGYKYLPGEIVASENLFRAPDGRIFTLGETLRTANYSEMNLPSVQNAVIKESLSSVADQLAIKPELLSKTGLPDFKPDTIYNSFLKSLGPATAAANTALIIAQFAAKPIAVVADVNVNPFSQEFLKNQETFASSSLIDRVSIANSTLGTSQYEFLCQVLPPGAQFEWNLKGIGDNWKQAGALIPIGKENPTGMDLATYCNLGFDARIDRIRMDDNSQGFSGYREPINFKFNEDVTLIDPKGDALSVKKGTEVKLSMLKSGATKDPPEKYTVTFKEGQQIQLYLGKISEGSRFTPSVLARDVGQDALIIEFVGTIT